MDVGADGACCDRPRIGKSVKWVSVEEDGVRCCREVVGVGEDAARGQVEVPG